MEQIKWFATPEQRENWTNRELWHADMQDDYRLEGATGKNTSGVPDLMVTTRCKKVVVYKPKTALRVAVKDAPYGKTVKTLTVKAGQTWEM